MKHPSKSQTWYSVTATPMLGWQKQADIPDLAKMTDSIFSEETLSQKRKWRVVLEDNKVELWPLSLRAHMDECNQG